jgi:hypothetical protein
MLCLVALTRSLTTRIRRSMSGTCSFALAKFTRGPPGMASINGLRGSNSLSSPTEDLDDTLDDTPALAADAQDNTQIPPNAEIHAFDIDPRDPDPDPPAIVNEPVPDQPETTTNTPVLNNTIQPSLRRSKRIRVSPKPYVPNMTGSRYQYAISQLASKSVLYPDSLASMSPC